MCARVSHVGSKIRISPSIRQKECVVQIFDFRVHKSLSRAHVSSNDCDCCCESTEKKGRKRNISVNTSSVIKRTAEGSDKRVNINSSMINFAGKSNVQRAQRTIAD